MIDHVCSRISEGGCTRSGTKGRTPSLFVWEGVRFCMAHLPAAARKAMQVNCSHSFVDRATGGDCTYCGKIVPFGAP